MGLTNRFYGMRVHDDLGQAIDDMFSGFESLSSATIPWRDGMKLIDEKDYDIFPKKHVIERRLKEREEDLSRIRKQKENTTKYYEGQEKALSTEIDYLRRELAKSISP